MKKKLFTVAMLCALLASASLQSCIGSYALFNKLLAWNKTVGNKFENAAVFLAFWILPAYPVAWIADSLVLNTIEFWSGTSPIASTKTVIDGKDGRYLVERDSKGYTITNLNDNSKVRLNYAESTQTWSIVGIDGKEWRLMTFVDDKHIQVPTADGQMMTIERSEAGLYAYQQALLSDSKLFASSH